jgi:RNA polymerase sigma-B factor
MREEDVVSVARSSSATNEKFRAYSRSRDRRLRDELVEMHFGLARVIASRYQGGSEPFDDLIQVANIGLVKSVERYRPDFGTSFSTFATPTILGALKRHLRDHTWSLHVARSDKDLRLRVRDATEAAQHRLARSAPSVGAIADQAGLSESDVVRGQLALQLYKQPALDPTTAAADIAPMDDDFERVDNRALLDALVAQLPRLDRTIVESYYLEGRSQVDIGRQLGRSQMFVSRRLARSRTTLRRIAVGTGSF